MKSEDEAPSEFKHRVTYQIFSPGTSESVSRHSSPAPATTVGRPFFTTVLAGSRQFEI